MTKIDDKFIAAIATMRMLQREFEFRPTMEIHNQKREQEAIVDSYLQDYLYDIYGKDNIETR